MDSASIQQLIRTNSGTWQISEARKYRGTIRTGQGRLSRLKAGVGACFGALAPTVAAAPRRECQQGIFCGDVVNLRMVAEHPRSERNSIVSSLNGLDPNLQIR